MTGSDGSASELLKTMDNCLSLPGGEIIHAMQDKLANGCTVPTPANSHVKRFLSFPRGLWV